MKDQNVTRHNRFVFWMDNLVSPYKANDFDLGIEFGEGGGGFFKVLFACLKRPALATIT